LFLGPITDKLVSELLTFDSMVMTITKTKVEKFDRDINFGIWQLKMETILIQNRVDLALKGVKEKAEKMTTTTFEDLDKRARSNIILNSLMRFFKGNHY
jgi:hypothetical protein